MLRCTLVAGLAWLGIAAPAAAGVYTDDLSRCLIESTSPADKATLVQWIFSALSQHPTVAALSKATPEDVERINGATGVLFMRLMTESCVEKSRAAIKYEGLGSIQASFGVLGQVATADLLGDEKVRGVLAGLEKHVDVKKLESALKPQ
jgi:hypothetical protein